MRHSKRELDTTIARVARWSGGLFAVFGAMTAVGGAIDYGFNHNEQSAKSLRYEILAMEIGSLVATAGGTFCIAANKIDERTIVRQGLRRFEIQASLLLGNNEFQLPAAQLELPDWDPEERDVE